MSRTERLYSFYDWTSAQDYDVGVELPVLAFDSLKNRYIRKLYNVVYDGELKDQFGREMKDEFGNVRRKKLFELVE